MWSNLPLFPPQASTFAAQVDGLYAFLIAVSVVFGGLIVCLLVYFAVKYRRRTALEQPVLIHGDIRLELLWTIIPLSLAMTMFAWGASLYVTMSSPPQEAMEIHVVGKQWMWKFQHPEGPREINELHVPAGQPVQLVMTSEDVIHSVYVPAFRIKMDAVPGRYTTTWFEATKTGTFHLFCAEYCGTSHAGMIGRVVVMPPAEYEQWLSGDVAGETPVQTGERLFQQLGCHTCHRAVAGGRGPTLVGVFGQPVRLQSGEETVVDEGYLRESILRPNAKVVAGYPPIMPTFQGQISEEDILHILAYIRSLGTQQQ
jgi:cytochrome c oxidase subunit 2